MTAAPQQSTALAEPYAHQIGKVTFQVSSFGNPKAAQTAEQMLLGMMERAATQPKPKKEDESA